MQLTFKIDSAKEAPSHCGAFVPQRIAEVVQGIAEAAQRFAEAAQRIAVVAQGIAEVAQRVAVVAQRIAEAVQGIAEAPQRTAGVVFAVKKPVLLDFTLRHPMFWPDALTHGI
jgi:methyl-accepting chemotaxis protein